MNGQIDWSELFFSAQGRASRVGSWIAAVILLIIAALYEAVVGSTLHWLTGWFVYPALIYCGACVLSKRLHDRGRSGWWATLILAAIVAIWPHPDGFFDFFFTLVLICANRYGPNPLRPPLTSSA
jgi:uncharacterized membrane protein YhaH (DUF805 family)